MRSKLFLSSLTVLMIGSVLSAQTRKGEPSITEIWEPEPKVVTPGQNNSAPSDAIILFDGKNFDNWVGVDGKPAQWTLEGDAFTVKPRTGGIQTKKEFGNVQLHIEWRAPSVVKGEGQGRGNSGIFLQSRYELQVLDSYQNRTYSNGQAGGIYKQHMPLVNACRPPGEWQTYDVIYTAPEFNADSIRIKPATITVLHNGVLVQNNVPIYGTTEYIGAPYNVAHGKGPLMLQDHGDLVSYRNIWVREL